MIEIFTRRPLVDRALIVAALASAALLLGAHLFEAAGYAPCQLCLDQRQAHWAALGVAAIGLVFSFFERTRRAAAATVGAVALIYLVSAGLSFYHAGVEFKFWPGPATCAAGSSTGLDAGALIDALQEKPKAPACEDAAWRLFGVSMAGYNLLASAGLFALCLVAAASAAREARQSRRPSAIEAMSK